MTNLGAQDLEGKTMPSIIRLLARDNTGKNSCFLNTELVFMYPNKRKKRRPTYIPNDIDHQFPNKSCSWKEEEEEEEETQRWCWKVQRNHKMLFPKLLSLH